MNEEMESLQRNTTWALVDLPKGKKIIGCKWVFKRKEDTHRTTDSKYEACLVAKGYSQVEGIDYNDIFSPVVKHSSFLVLLVLVVAHDMELE